MKLIEGLDPPLSVDLEMLRHKTTFWVGASPWSLTSGLAGEAIPVRRMQDRNRLTGLEFGLVSRLTTAAPPSISLGSQ